MKSYVIKGGKKLSGVVDISGAKNAALPVLAATIMTKGENVLFNCPDISDVDSMVKILSALGCVVVREKELLHINADNMSGCRIPDHLMKEMRSSVFLAGSLLTRCGEAVISNPGGCNIGRRPIDIHIYGLRKLGVRISTTEKHIVMKADNLKGTDIVLPYPSVGATENIMMAALSAKGTTRIINSAREPEIADLQKYINNCGGLVNGAGTGQITIEGGHKLNGCCHGILPDRIEAGTFILMALGTRGNMLLRGICRQMVEPLAGLLEQAGYEINDLGSAMQVVANDDIRMKCHIETAPYPGFPTDLQPQITTFLTGNGRGSVIEENIFENRFEYAKQLKKMGADIEISEKKVIINNNNILCGTSVEAQDLRGGAALVIAGLMASGYTIVSNTKYIKRGYSDFTEKIKGIGGDIAEYECGKSYREG